MSVNPEDLKNKLAERQPTQPGTGVARQEKPSAATMVRQAIERQSESFRAVMPKGVDGDRFGRLVLTAVKATPQLMECFGTEQGQVTVLLAAMQAAAVGLEPNTATQECWLLPRRRKGVTECQLSIGYRGLLKLARRAGTIKTVFAEVVHEKDVFTWSRGLEEDHLEHVPYDGTDDPGPLTYAYAVARYKEGGYSFIVLNRKQVEKRRAMSDSWKNDSSRPYSPWTTWEDEQWKKSALRALSPYLEMSTDDARALQADERGLRMGEDGVIDVDDEKELAAAPALPAPPPSEDDDEEELKPAAAQDDKAQESARKALMAQATKAFPLADLKGKAQTGARDVLRHAVAFCELGEHKSSNAMTAAEIRRVHSRLEQVEAGDVTVTADDEHHRVLVKNGDQEIPVTYEQIGVE